MHARDSRPAAGRCARAAARAATVVSAALLICGFMAPQGSVQARDLGTWLTDDRKAKIKLRECGGDSLCSEIVWLRDPVDENGEPWRDELNPDPSKRRRKVVGIDVLKGMEKTGQNTWSGEIYDPEEGEYYYLKRLAVSEQRVELKGCLSTGWPCRTKYWTRTAPVNNEPARVANADQASGSGTEPETSGDGRDAGAARGQARSQPRQEENRAGGDEPEPRRQQDTQDARNAQETQQAAVMPQPQTRPGAQTREQTQSREPAQSRQDQSREPETPPQRRSAVPAPSERPQPPSDVAARSPRQQGEQNRQEQPRRRAGRQEAPSSAGLPWRSETETARRRPRTTTGSLRRRRAPGGAPGGGYHVQVTAEQDHDAALRRFGRLQQRFPSLLGGYLPNVQRVDLGAKGVWFRVRIGPMQRRTAAVNLCEQLKAAGGDCLVRRE